MQQKDASNISSEQWAEIRAALPTEKNQQDKEKRYRIFNKIDCNGNGYLSLAEVDKGLKDCMNLGVIFDQKPVLIKAFNAAKGSVKSKSKYGDDYVTREEFRLLLQYLRQYFEYYVMFKRMDEDDDRRISFQEFQDSIGELEK